MAEREEIEINLKSTADTSGAQQMAAALKQVQQTAQGTSGGTVPNVEYLRQVRETELARVRDQSRTQLTFTGAVGQANSATTLAEGRRGVVSPAFAALENSASKDRLAAYTNEQKDKQRIDLEYQKNITADRLRTQKEQQAESDRLYRLHGTQNTQYEQAFNRARREGRVPVGGGGGPQGPGGPTLPPNLQDLADNQGGGGGNGGGANGGIFDRNTQSAIRFTAALAGMGVGLSIYYFAGRLLHQAIAAIVDDEKNAIQATINLNAAFGDSARAYDTLAKSISTGGQGSGFIFKASDVQQTISGFKGLQDQFRLSGTQITDLTIAATKLAAIHDIPLSDAAGALSQALSGSAGAADKLGLSLSDVTVQTQYANGQFAGAFDLLSPAEQAAARLAVAEQQVADQSKNVATNINPLGAAVRDLGAAWENFNKSIGSPALEAASKVVEGLATALKALNIVIDDLKSAPPIIGDIGKGLAIIAGISLTGPVGGLTALLGLLGKNDVVAKAWEDAKKAVGDYLSQVGKTTDLPQTGIGDKLNQAFDTAKEKANELKDAAGQVINGQQGQQQQQQISIIDQLGKKDQELATNYDELTRSVDNFHKASQEVWTGLAQAAPAIQNQVNAFTGAVQNINNLTGSQRQSLAIRQAELGALKEHQLQVAQTQQAEFGEVSAVQELVDAYKNLIDAQGEVNRLQQEGVQLQGRLAQAQLNALAQTRAAQDEELRIQRDQLVASDRLISAQERAAGRRDIRQARIQQPDVQLRAFDANLPSIQIQRQEEVNQLLTRIAQATEAQAQQQIDLRITVNGAQVSTGTAG